MRPEMTAAHSAVLRCHPEIYGRARVVTRE
jgi:hypothetical protein